MKKINYAQLLAHHIKQSGLTLRQIAQQCRERNHAIDPSYISKLQTNHLPPPSEEVSKSLAEVLGANVDDFIYLGYIEKAPAFIKQRLLEQDIPAEILSCAKRILKLPPHFRQKIMNEIQWLEALDKTSVKPE